MKMYKTENDGMRVGAYKKDGKYILKIETKCTRIVATKYSSKAHTEEYIRSTTKEFVTAEQANNYFKAIKKNHPSLTLM